MQRTSTTPLAVARQTARIDSERDLGDWNGWPEVIAFLEQCSRPAKRSRSTLSMEERAAQAGVLDRLKPIPETLRAAALKGSEDAKKQLQKIQIANQQIVSRAENKKVTCV